MALYLVVAIIALILMPAGPMGPDSTTPVVEESGSTLTPGSAGYGEVVSSLRSIPANFVPNTGQTSPEVVFMARLATQRATAYFTPGGSTFVYDVTSGDKPGDRAVSVIKMEFPGANTAPQITGEDIQGTRSYFFNAGAVDSDGLENFSRIRYRDLYPGIDLIFYSRSGDFAYDFELAPGADISQIAISLPGARSISVRDDGAISTEYETGTFIQSPPYIYQDFAGKRREVSGGFRLTGESTYGFRATGYDPGARLVIDPALSYSTYLGGSGHEKGLAIAIDSSGAAYVTGWTYSNDFPTTPGAYDTTYNLSGDVFITKLAPSGTSLSYSTYLGGYGTDFGYGISIDSSGAAYVTGHTASYDFPTTPGAYDTTFNGGFDAFVTKLAPGGGSLSYSTYLGGSDDDLGNAIAIDSSGAAYVTGRTYSNNFPTTPGAYDTTYNIAGDAFVTKLAPGGGSLSYSTYLGGSDDDLGNAIAIDSSGAAYVTGHTTSYDFPTTPGAYDTTYNLARDAFVTKLAPGGGSLSYSTYLGGSDEDLGNAIAIDSSGAAYVTGRTYSTDLPTTAGAYDTTHNSAGDAFVTKLAPGGGSLSYSNYLGGSDEDWGNAIVVDSSAVAHVTGYTYSSDFPITAWAHDTIYNGGTDAFVTKFTPGGNAVSYSTYLGGSDWDEGSAIAIDSSGAAYVTGRTHSTDLPTTAGAYDTTHNGTGEVFVAKLFSNTGPYRANTNSANAQSQGPASRGSISDGGQSVAFHSPAPDLVPGDTNSSGDVFVKDVQSGALERASVSSGGAQGDGASIVPQITPDAKYVTFFSSATNLITGDTNSVGDIFVRDLKTPATERVSVATDGSQANGASRFPQITPDGRYVVFQSEASNLVPGDTNGKWDIFLRDRTLGTTERISKASDGTEANKASARPSISDDGNLITFHSWASNLVPGDTNGVSDVFVHNRATSTTVRVSLATDGTQGNGESQFPKISGNGAAVVYHSMANNLVAGDTNGARDTFVRNIGSSTTERVSVASDGTEANNISGFGAISRDGRYVVFHAQATNLVPGDTNGVQDVFMRDRVANVTTRRSLANNSSQSDNISGMAAISTDGTSIAFQSKATNLVSGDTNGAQDIFYG